MTKKRLAKKRAPVHPPVRTLYRDAKGHFCAQSKAVTKQHNGDPLELHNTDSTRTKKFAASLLKKEEKKKIKKSRKRLPKKPSAKVSKARKNAAVKTQKKADKAREKRQALAKERAKLKRKLRALEKKRLALGPSSQPELDESAPSIPPPPPSEPPLSERSRNELEEYRRKDRELKERLRRAEEILESTKDFVNPLEPQRTSIIDGSICIHWSEARARPEAVDWFERLFQHDRGSRAMMAEAMEIAAESGMSVQEIYTLGMSP